MGDDIDRIVSDFQTEMSAVAEPGAALTGLRTSMGKETELPPLPPAPPADEARPAEQHRGSWTPS